MVMATSPSSRKAFKFNSIVNNLHNSVNRAVEAVWGYTGAEPAMPLPIRTRVDSSITMPSTANSGAPRVSYLEEKKTSHI